MELTEKASWRDEATVYALVFFFVLSVVGPLVHPYADQQASRYALTAAIWDNRSVSLDGFEQVVGRDAAYKDGHLYSDKAPLQPFLAVPLYGVYRGVGGESATVLRLERNLGLWWQTLWMAAVPLALMSLLLVRLGERFDSRIAVRGALAVVFGTILLPFGSLLFGHSLAALFLLGAVYLLVFESTGRARLLAAGALVGASVATEYPAAVALLALIPYALWKVRWRTVWFILGGLPFLAFVGIYHTMAFGSPLSHPYRYNVIHGVVSAEKSFLSEFSSLRLDHLFQIFFAGRGFLIASPVVILGLVGLLYGLRRPDRSSRASAALFLALFCVFLAIPMFWGNPWGGFSPGPRYLAPALPLLMAGVMIAWDIRPFVTRIAVGLSVVTMVLATLTNPLVDSAGEGGIGTWLGLAEDGQFVDTVFTMALGPIGWLVHGGLVAVVGWRLLRHLPGGSSDLTSARSPNSPNSATTD